MAEPSVVDGLMIVCGAGVTLLLAVAVAYWIRQEQREYPRQDAHAAQSHSGLDDPLQPAPGSPPGSDLTTPTPPEDRPPGPTDPPP